MLEKAKLYGVLDDELRSISDHTGVAKQHVLIRLVKGSELLQIHQVTAHTTKLRSAGFSPRASNALARRSRTNSLRRSAYSHPAGERSESAL